MSFLLGTDDGSPEDFTYTWWTKRDNVRGMASLPNPYDQVAYPSRAFAQTHPDRLAVVGTLLGMNTTPVERCRVLELACGDGSNLIPMAYGLPGSAFRGVDLATKPVEKANEMIHRLGLTNIRIEQRDLLEVDERFETFDYIIAHGVYAWVPERVQEKILSICQANLAASGIALVSYNANPAGCIRRMLREAIQLHVVPGRRPGDEVTAARELAQAISSVTEGSSAWKALLNEEFKAIFDRDEHVIFHDDLGDCFAPLSFSEFARRAAGKGLQAVGDASLKGLWEPDATAEGLTALRTIAGDDSIAYQQYLDFATYRRFRQTLLCHAGIPLKRDCVVHEAQKLFVATPLKVAAERPDGSVQFINSRGQGTVETNNPHVINALKHLAMIWPGAARFAELLPCDCEVNGATHEEISNGLAEAFVSLSAKSLVDLRTYHWRLADGLSERPTASLLARIQSQTGSLITTLLHTHVEVEDDEGRRFLQLLDGSRNHQAIAEALRAAGSGGAMEDLLRRVEENLALFHRLGLFIA